MAYAFEILEVVKAAVAGAEFWTITIKETDVSAGDEWELPRERMPPTPCVVTLYEAEITDAGGSGATTLQAELGFGKAFPTSGLGFIAVADAAEATHRIQTERKIPAVNRNQPGNRIRGRSQPDLPNVPVVTTRVTFRLGD